MSRKQLQAMWIAGDPLVFDHLHNQFFSRLTSYLMGVFNLCEAKAQDCATEAFIKLQRIFKNPKVTDVVGLLYLIGRQSGFKQKGEDGRDPLGPNSIGGDDGELLMDGTPSERPSRVQDDLDYRIELVLAYFKILDPKEQEAILLHLWEDMTFEEIGQLLGEPMGTVKARYRRAIQKLKDRLKHKLEDKDAGPQPRATCRQFRYDGLTVRRAFLSTD